MRSGRATRATSGPAISRHRSTKVASLNPARWKAACASMAASIPIAAARARRETGSVSADLGDCFRACGMLFSDSPTMPQSSRTSQTNTRAASRLLAWYDANRRVLPWRAQPGENPDPYRVWLSEIMLQQTTVAAVGSYYHKFLARWPTVQRLAEASLDEIRAAWAGLGYYSRARNLHRAAQTISGEL